MNESIPTSWRSSQKARRAAMLRGIAVILVAASLMIAASAALAKRLPPNVPNGVIVHACPDAYETDDLQGNASTLTAGSPQLHNFDGNTILGVADKDWARFQVVQGGVYTLTTSDLSPQADTVLRLYDPSSNLLAENDNAPGLGLASQIVWTAPVGASGWYYVSVDPTGTTATTYANCAGVVVSYTLSLQSKIPNFLFLPVVSLNF